MIRWLTWHGLIIIIAASGLIMIVHREALCAQRSKMAPPRYIITDITRRMSYGNSIDDDGDIVGTLVPSLGPNSRDKLPTCRPFWWRSGMLRDLGKERAELGNTSTAMSVQNGPIIVGVCIVIHGGRNKGLKSWMYKGGNVTFIESPNGRGFFGSHMVSKSGVVVGIDSPLGRPCIYSDNSSHELATLGPGGTGSADGLNDSGHIVGAASAGKVDLEQAVVWTGSKISRLCALPSTGISRAFSINNTGSSVGYYTPAGRTQIHACVFTHGAVRDFGTLGGGWSKGYSINSSGQIVGESANINNLKRAFVITQGRMYNLNKCIDRNSGWLLTSAKCINSSGRIVGTGYFKGEQRAFLLTPVGRPTRRQL